MRYVLERVSGPEIEPVTLAEAKLHLGEFDDVTTHDDEISELVTAAREWAEDFTGLAMIDQTWRITFGDSLSVDRVGEPSRECARSESRGTDVYLRRSPAIDIVSFKSVSAEGVETDVDAANYELREADGKWPRVVAKNGASWATGEYRITFRAGYANRDVSPADGAEVVPARVKQAMKIWLEAHYDRDAAAMPGLVEAAKGLLKPLRADLGIA